MTIQQIYEKYSTPKNLQGHMLRVGALSKIICDNWTGQDINKLEIIKACALHDIAKPVSFDVSPENLLRYKISPEDQINLIELQKFIKTKYGDDEHKASVGMCKDIGMDTVGLRVLDNIEWFYIPELLKVNDLESLASIYCDMRIGPKGILNIQERIGNLISRYTPDKYAHNDFERNGQNLEQKIQEFVSIDLNSITDENLNSLFPVLLNLEI